MTRAPRPGKLDLRRPLGDQGSAIIPDGHDSNDLRERPSPQASCNPPYPFTSSLYSSTVSRNDPVGDPFLAPLTMYKFPFLSAVVVIPATSDPAIVTHSRISAIAL